MASRTWTWQLAGCALCLHSLLWMAAVPRSYGAPVKSAADMMQGVMKEMSEHPNDDLLDAMSELMRTAGEEAAEEVLGKADAEGEAAAFQAALKEAFEAFDTDSDGRLTGIDLKALLTVTGRAVPKEAEELLKNPDFTASYNDFLEIYEAAPPDNSDADDDAEGDDEQDHDNGGLRGEL
eukprot:TRINITY_DN56554_c0_g1_i1.p1 TRINITY_DN56554_c0_g1~~TRINITY_DN56554_c0_g1_i1.p1  ORF type:complete len:179 (-),score=62.42 TRINITY_DN56554_c0_g1_i1:35-571(-)